MLPTLEQIRDVKLMEEEEALEMGREATTIRHPFVFHNYWILIEFNLF